VVYQDAAHLHGPPRLIFAPNGDLQVANADPAVSQDPNEPSEIVQFTRGGRLVRQYSVDPNLGSAFAPGIARHDDTEVFAYVDDFLSSCTILNLSATTGSSRHDAFRPPDFDDRPEARICFGMRSEVRIDG
jgi:hypothetical protein